MPFYLVPLLKEGENLDLPEIELFSTDLEKDSLGLGITIAGYIGESPLDELSGIFVKSITPGSAAYTNGNIRVNDQIMEVSNRRNCVEHFQGLNTLVWQQIINHEASLLKFYSILL